MYYTAMISYSKQNADTITSAINVIRVSKLGQSLTTVLELTSTKTNKKRPFQTSY